MQSQTQSVSVSKPINSKERITMFDKTMRKLQELAESRVKELNVPAEDQVSRVRVYLARNGHLVAKQLDSIPFSHCLFKHIAPLSELLEVAIDPKLLQVNKEQTREDVLCNRLKLEQYLTQIDLDGKTYYPMGATGSLKEARMWFATEAVTNLIHEFFNDSEASGTYLGILLSQGWEGEFTCNRVGIYSQDKDCDGMGYIRLSYAKEHGIHSQAQVRIIDIENRAAAKGTLLPMDDRLFSGYFGYDKDIAINPTLIKSTNKVFQTCVISVRSLAEFRSMKSSFQILQHISPEGLSILKPAIDARLDDIFTRFKDKDAAVEALKIRLVEQDDTLLADTKLSMLMLSNLPADHPWLVAQLQRLWLEELREIAIGGGICFMSGTAAFDPSLKQGEVRFLNGSVFMNMTDLSGYLFGDCDGDLLPFMIDRESRTAILTRYPVVQSSAILKLRVVGDIPMGMPSNPLAVDVLSNHVKRLAHVNSPETRKKHTPLSNLLSVLLDGSVGGSIGGSTLALAASIAHPGKDDITRELTLYSQQAVLSFKHFVVRQTSISPSKVLKDLGNPAWFDIKPQKLSDFQPVNYPGTVALCWNHVASRIIQEMSILNETKKSPAEFRSLIPIPKSFRRREFVRIYEYFKKYCRHVSSAIESRNEDALDRVIKATEMIGLGMSDTDVALAYHISHMGKGLGSFAIHLNVNKLVKLLGYNVPDLPSLKVLPDPTIFASAPEPFEKQINLCLRKFFVVAA